ncbi:hypothetical protein PF008_g31654 [Phytophthora fragariae]|uniref:Pectate lyase n=1 Tax=Phytophthora fragariae TaxID=53985 RepID=A0A6G0Q2N1_9STRA|nr:hypothetical protein PF008_g31654 [Phytophthora fragariae]
MSGTCLTETTKVRAGIWIWTLLSHRILTGATPVGETGEKYSIFVSNKLDIYNLWWSGVNVMLDTIIRDHVNRFVRITNKTNNKAYASVRKFK